MPASLNVLAGERADLQGLSAAVLEDEIKIMAVLKDSLPPSI
jgi:hypothetical protein